MHRNRFFQILETGCKKKPEKLAINFTEFGSKKSAAVTYGNLYVLLKLLQDYFKNNLPSQSSQIGVCVTRKECFIPLILALWKNNHSIATLHANQPDIQYLDYIILDDVSWIDQNHYKLLKTFKILSRKLYLFQSTSKNGASFTEDMCYRICTSGSTGTPKAVQVPWSCIYPNAEQLAHIFEISDVDVVASVAPYTFDPFFIELFCCIMKCAQLLIVNPRRDPVEDLCGSESVDHFYVQTKTVPIPAVTILQATPSLFSLVFSRNSTLLRNLRVLVLGGEAFPEIDLSNLAAKVYNIYGITEVSCWAFIQEITKEGGKISIGKPLEGIEYKIDEGELLIGSKTRKCVVGNERAEELSEMVWRRTGDHVVEEVDMDTLQTSLYISGRKDDIIKKFGHKVSIVKTISELKACSIIDDSRVIFEPKTKQIVWFLVIEDDSLHEALERICPLKHQEIFNVVNKLRDIERPDLIFQIRKIPITAHGKTDLVHLRTIVKSEASKNKRLIFASVWRESLNQDAIDYNNGFLDCGGNSILAIQIISRLEAAAVKVPVTLLQQLLLNEKYQSCLELVERTNSSNIKHQLEDLNGHCEVLERINMSVKWSHNMKKCIDAPPQLLKIDGKLFAVVGSHSSELAMVFADTGQGIWTTKLGDRIESGIAVSSDRERLYTGCYDHTIYCLDSRSGNVIWKFKTGGMIKTTPVISHDGQHVYCGSYDKQIYCLKSDNGHLVSSLTVTGSILATSILEGSTLFTVTLDGTCFALESNSFRVIWNKTLKSPVFSSPCLLSDRRVLVAEVQGILHCMNLDTGQVEWDFACGGNVFSGLMPVTPENTLVTFGCHDKHLYLLSTAPVPKLIWKIQLHSTITSTPAVCNQLIVVAESSGILYLVGLDATLRGKIQLGGEIFSSPKFNGNLIFIGCRDDNLVCVQI